MSENGLCRILLVTCEQNNPDIQARYCRQFDRVVYKRAMTDGEGELSLPRRVGLLVDDGQALVGDVEYSWENRAHETFLWVDLLYHNVQWGIPTEVKGDKEFGKNRRFPGILWRVASLAA